MGHREIFLCLSDGNRAFWLRYLLSTRKETKGSFMMAIFSTDNASGFRTFYGSYSMNPLGETKVGGHVINTEKGLASDMDNSYSLDWSSKEAGMSAISGITRLLDMRSQYVLLSPDALFNGHIRYLDQSHVIKDYRGMLGYISQPDYLRQWTWMHMFTSDDRNMWIDLLISGREFGGRKVSLFSGRFNGRLIHSFLPATFSGTADISGIEGVVRAVGEKFIINSHSDTKKILKVKYDAVRKYDAYCYNSVIAVTSLEYGGRIYNSDVSFLEHGAVDNLRGFVEVASTEKKSEETCHK